MHLLKYSRTEHKTHFIIRYQLLCVLAVRCQLEGVY